jgi:hypothetical protein
VWEPGVKPRTRFTVRSVERSRIWWNQGWTVWRDRTRDDENQQEKKQKAGTHQNRRIGRNGTKGKGGGEEKREA